MTGTMYKLLKERRREGQGLESAGGKQSAWSKIGMGVGGLLAMGLTGGAATPLVAAAMAGGGTLAGGLLGRGLARSTKGGKIKAGRFYGDEAADLKSQIGSSIWTGAGKAALGAGLTSLGGSLSLGKEGLKLGKIGSVGKDGAKLNLSNLLDKGKTAATGTYSDSLWGKLGQAIDYKGSFIGKGLPMLQKGATNLAGDISTGFGNKSMDWSTLPEGMSPRDYQALVGERQASYAASMQAPGPSMVMGGDAPVFDAFQDPGQYSDLAWSGPTASVDSAADLGPIKPGSEFYQEETASALKNLRTEAGYPQDIPFDRSSMLRRQRTARLQGTADFTPFSGGPGNTIAETSNFPVGESADVIMDQGLIGPSESIPFDRSSILKRQATARYQGGARPTPFSGGGEGFTQTSAWEGVGESFPVTSPEMVTGPYSRGTFGLPSTTRGYDFKSVAGKRHRDTLDSIRWQDRLFGD